MLTDAELLHQAAADVRLLPAATTSTVMDSLTRWCPGDPGRVRTLVGQVVAHANGGKPDSGLAYDRVVAEGPAALARLMDRYAAHLDQAAMMDIMSRPQPDEDLLLLNEVVRLGTVAADRMMKGQHSTAAEATEAAIREAFACALGNGLIRFVPREEWPDWWAFDPPYKPPVDGRP
jgi:hypothetical protein